MSTGGSLTTTSSGLTTTRRLLSEIEGVLDVAQRADSQGTELIPINVAEANGVLRPVEEDAQDIDEELNEVNKHLTSVCESTLVLRGVPLATLANPAMLTPEQLNALLATLRGAATNNNNRNAEGEC